jgi:hypothetical protein
MGGLRVAGPAVAFEKIMAGLIGMEDMSRFTCEMKERLAVMCGLGNLATLRLFPAPLHQQLVDWYQTVRSQRHGKFLGLHGCPQIVPGIGIRLT